MSTPHDDLLPWMAEHVMGWKRVDKFADMGPDKFMIIPQGVVVLRNEGWHPDTNPGQAFEVLNRMRMTGVRLQMFSDDIKVERFLRCSFLQAVWETVWKGRGVPLPLAICLAARALFEGDNPS